VRCPLGCAGPPVVCPAGTGARVEPVGTRGPVTCGVARGGPGVWLRVVRGPDSGLMLVHQCAVLCECAGLGAAAHPGLRSGREPLRGVCCDGGSRAAGVVGSARAVGLPPHQPNAAAATVGVPVYPVSSGHPLRLRRGHRPCRGGVGAAVRGESLDPGRRRGARRRSCQPVVVPVRHGLGPGPEHPDRRRYHPPGPAHTRTAPHSGGY